jgi:hypothetical protein
MTRKPYADALKALGIDFNKPGVLAAFDLMLDKAGIGRDSDAPAARPSQRTVPDDYFPLLAKIESGNRPYVKAKSSSASGLYQFIRSTWRGEGGEWGTDMGQAFGGLKPSVEEQTARARSFTEKNAAILRGKGVPINKASLYAAHFLGAGTALRR